jgi:hypothetical protein
MLDYMTKHSDAQVKSVATQMKNEYKAAEKLKNATDFRLEKEAKERAGVASTIRSNIKLAFEEWNLKGEFEKESDFAERLRNNSQTVFDSICISNISIAIGMFLSDKYKHIWEKELSLYNSEKEFFTVLFKINDKSNFVSWQNSINIPIAQAENFKNNFSNLRMKIGDYDWCYIKKNLCPTALTLYRKDGYGDDAKIIESYKLPVNLPNQTEISVPFDELGIANPYLKGYVFKYSTAKAIAREKFVTDSIAKREKFIQDSIVARERFVRDSIQQEQNEITQIQDILASNCRCGYNVPFIQIIGFNNKGAYSNFLGRRTDFSNIVSELKNIYFSFNNSRLYITTAEMVDFINACKQKPYYSKVIDLVVDGNAWLWKEYQKNGKYFESKVEFYDTYISDNYKQILKENKKKK